ncbi:MAG: thioredoxin family protein, partial [Lentisphaerae bacterium]|nr:thioredoxin family protein [Lentisphaerota bacterium]
DRMSVEPVGAFDLEARSAPDPKVKKDPFTEEDVRAYVGNPVFAYLVTGSAGDEPRVRVRYQGCSDEICLRPMEVEVDVAVPGASRKTSLPPLSPGFTDPQAPPVTATVTPSTSPGLVLVGKEVGYLDREDFLAFLDGVESGGPPRSRNRIGSVLEQRGVWAAVLLILLGGLALNFTPCVLPMIPVNIAIIGAGTQAGSRGRGLLLGSAYGAGIAVVYGLLGLVVMLTGTRFGVLNASPWFNFGVAAVFLVLSLAMFDVLRIDFSRFQSAGSPRGTRGSIFTAMGLGGLAALLAGACVAPVVISVLLVSADLYARGQAAGLLLPFLLGLGMALPWPFAGAGLSFLPKPGRWMNRVKFVFGAVILLFAVRYGLLGTSLLRARSDASRAAVVEAQDRLASEGWHTSIDAAVAESLRVGKPVFVDIWASWCKSCLKMEHTTFSDPEVLRRLDAYIKVKYRAEDPESPDIKPVLDGYGVVGLPTYLVLEAREDAEGE